MPPVYELCSDLSKVLVLTTNLYGSFEVVTAGVHMATSWENVGSHMLELLQEGCSSFHSLFNIDFDATGGPKQVSVTKLFSIDSDCDLQIHLSILRMNSNRHGLTFNILANNQTILRSVCNSIAWAIGALRLPWPDMEQSARVKFVKSRVQLQHSVYSAQKLSAIPVSASFDGERMWVRGNNNRSPGEPPLLSFDEKKDAWESQAIQDGPFTCWKELFSTIVVMEREPDVFERYPSGSSAVRDSLPGLLVDYEVLLHLSAVTHEVLYEDSIVLMGFETALIPLTPLENQRSGVVRWHFISTPGEQITYDLLDVPNRLIAQESNLFNNTKALVGWTNHARMLLGSCVMGAVRLQISSARQVQQPKLRLKSLKPLRPQVALNVGIMPVFSFTLNPKRETVQALLPCQIAFNPASNLSGILNQASKMHFILVDPDGGHGKAWMVPALNYLIFAVACYLKENNYTPPYPCYTPTTALSDPEALQQEIQELLGQRISFKRGTSEMLLEDIIQEIWQRTASAKKRIAKWISQSVIAQDTASFYGMELYNVICDGELQLKRLSLDDYPSIAAWRALCWELCIFFAPGIGDLIQVIDAGNCPPCQDLSGIAKGVLHCRIPDLVKLASRHFSTQWTAKVHEYTLTDGVTWRISGNPFKSCDRDTCYGVGKLQKVYLENKGFKCANKHEGGQCGSEVPRFGGVRFGFPLQVSAKSKKQPKGGLMRQLEKIRRNGS
ncbi:hypothetical protein BDZ91DRAFT_725235 [Kalaharituber pfeilii]|nr:hypothetical protein BDZ91DRAFT_725235 [Kalaharituber pfeilii]